MRILLISAFYPPYVIGGWEQLVEDINARLRERGHATHVLTSSYAPGKDHASHPSSDPGVERSLTLETGLLSYHLPDFFLNYRTRLRRNLDAVRRTIEAFQPGVVFIHGMWNLHRGIAWQAEQLCPGHVVYYIANNWPYAPDAHTAYWRSEPRRFPQRLIKRLLAPVALRWIDAEMARFPLRFERVLCVSQAVRRDLAGNAGIPVANMQVVYNGVELDKFFPASSDLVASVMDAGPVPEENGRVSDEGDIARLAVVYAGSFAPHKGVHTAIEAMALICRKPRLRGVTLSLVGSGHPDYESRLRRMAEEAGLQGRVAFWPRVPREEMPELLRRFDALVFPSTWEEPLARMMQEAMASGLVVVGTPTGGSPEVLQDGRTGLTFPPGDAAALAECLETLALDPALRRRLALNAHRLVAEKFELGRMIAEVESALAAATGREGACASSS